MIKKQSGVEEVNNVVLYISDSVRWDTLPESIKQLGVSVRTITPSTFTGSSLPSIITSTYPLEHQVWNFSSKLSWKPYISELDIEFGVDVSEVWGREYENSEKPTLDLMNVNQHTAFDPLMSSFFHIIHDHGGHAPYGRETSSFKSSEGFFKEHKNNPQKIAHMYKKGVDESANRFVKIYDQLADQNKLEETLLIYTSDHGELLGEYGGIFGHSNPMVPELVNVPTVFCGAGLSKDSEFNRLISSIDLLPTVLAALNERIPRSMDGLNLWDTNVPRNRPIYSDVWKPSKFENVHYKASSVWSEHGGIVYHHSSKLSRLVFSLGHHYYLAPYAGLMRRAGYQGFKDILSCYNSEIVEFGSYSGNKGIETLKKRNFAIDEADRTEVNEELLRDLGYVK